MTREIKFRAWNTQENKMLFRKLFDMNWYETDKNDASGSHCWGAISGGQSRFLEVMQYTGLKDKNGKDVYEGDFVYLAGYGNYQAVFPFIELYEAESEKDIGEIIGNIYENPELLSKDK